VSAQPFHSVHLDALPKDRGADDSTWLRIRKHLDVRAFGVNAYRAGAGERVIEEHDETGSTAGRHEELYVVLSGHATFELAGEKVDAPTGTLIFVRDPATRRGAIAQEDRTTVLVVGGVPGKPYEVSVWEEASDAYPLYLEGRHEEAAEILGGIVERHPRAWGVLYNLACFESLSGHTEEALDHLRPAVENDEKLRELAKTDEDLDPIRDDPRFPA
jgi:mannose-6-phosphate isomerase-like protein (cupin superfamily)